MQVATQHKMPLPHLPDPRHRERSTMDGGEDILDLYQWHTGTCFRCARQNLPTTRVGAVRAGSGVEHEVRACRDCVLALESERRRAAVRRGRDYQPGELGKR